MKKRLTLFVLFLSITFSLLAQTNDENDEYKLDHHFALIEYVMNGQLDSMKQYVAKYDVDLSYYDKKHASEVLLPEVALVYGHIDIYHYLMEVDDAYKDVYSDLLIAALRNDFDTVISLVRDGADINSTTPSELTPLMFAVFHHNKEAFVQLVELGADTEDIGGHDINISDIAVYAMDKDIVKLLIDQGADINRKIGSDSMTMLHIMVEKGEKDQVRFLLELGVDINDQSNDLRFTPLMTAILNKNIDMMKLLLTFNPDLTRRDIQGETALMMCVSKYLYSTECINMLLDKKDDINVLDTNGQSLLMRAVYYPRTDIVRLLIEAGIDVNVVDKYGNTALSIAKELNNEEFIHLLQAAGAK